MMLIVFEGLGKQGLIIGLKRNTKTKERVVLERKTRIMKRATVPTSG